MARIELRDCVVRLKDGFGGSAQVDDTPSSGDTQIEIDTLTDLTNDVTEVPVGARFTAGSTTYTVTSAVSNEVVTVTLTDAEGGTFTLTFDGDTTAALDYDAVADDVETALEALSGIEVGDVVVSGAAGGPYRIEFQGNLASQDVGAVTADGASLDGSTPSIGIVETTTGGVGVDEEQTVTLSGAAGGTFTLTYSGNTTTDLDYDATAAEVQSALEALGSIGAGNVSVTGPDGGPWVVEFISALGETDVDMLTGDDSSLVGTTPVIDVAVDHAGGATWKLGFTPAIPVADVPSDDDPITFLPQQLEIKIGDGNLTYTEHNEYEYLLDRGDLDTVREGNEVPMDVKIDCVYEHITTGTGEDISPLDALKQKGEAVEWVSSADDKCEPYAVDVEVEHNVPCGTTQDETTLFPDFRSESVEVNFKDATIAISGKCNATEPIVSRS